MALIVQKYGGTSVKDSERIKAVAQRIIKTKEKGNQMVVVVSAPAGMTDDLIRLAHEICDTPPAREMDMLLATGEQRSIALLAMALCAQGHSAISFTGPQAGILTTKTHTKARILNIDPDRIKTELEKGNIVIVAGFQGATEDDAITTLDRGGSDTSAVAIAAGIKADVCEIYTDVDGVYTADPRIVKNPKKLDTISHDEMLEMASSGAKVLHSRAVEFAKKYDVPLYVLSSFNENPGTLVTKEVESMEDVVIRGVTHDKNQAKITIFGVPDKPGTAFKIFNKIGEAEINVDMIVQSIGKDDKATISFTVSKTDLRQALEIVKEVGKELGSSEVLADEKVAKVSIVGVGMRSHSGVAARMFQSLARENINIQMISTSEIKLSCIIDENDVERAVQAIHDEFNLSE
ncbi:TPA: aspartate kinase [Candidatus Poribacteria bacterium]|nr:aspartate kinase [Candidatus Poribacteria bacterium]